MGFVRTSPPPTWLMGRTILLSNKTPCHYIEGINMWYTTNFEHFIGGVARGEHSGNLPLPPES